MEDAIQIRHYRRQPTRSAEFLKRFYHDKLQGLYDDVTKFIENYLEPEDYAYCFIKDNDGKNMVDYAFDLFYYQRRIDKKKKLEFGDNDVREWLQIIREYPDNLQQILIEAIVYIDDVSAHHIHSPALADSVNSEIFLKPHERYALFIDGKYRIKSHKI